VVLGSFTVARIHERSADLEPVLDAALGHYRRRSEDDPERPLPPTSIAEALDLPLVEVEVDLAPATAAALESESRRLHVDSDLVLNHAVLLYLADLDRQERRPRCGGRNRGPSPLGR
jgi:hypothetical protein